MLACMAGVGLAKCDGKCSQPPRPLGALVQASEKTNKSVPHHFWLPATCGGDRLTTICVPQKNGNRNFGGLVYAANHQRAPFDYDDMKVSLSCFDHRMPMANCSRVYIIARNPFTRLMLSTLPRHTSFGTLRVVMLGVARSRRRFLPACRRRTTSAVLTDDGLYIRQAATDL